MCQQVKITGRWRWQGTCWLDPWRERNWWFRCGDPSLEKMKQGWNDEVQYDGLFLGKSTEKNGLLILSHALWSRLVIHLIAHELQKKIWWFRRKTENPRIGSNQLSGMTRLGEVFRAVFQLLVARKLLSSKRPHTNLGYGNNWGKL